MSFVRLYVRVLKLLGEESRLGWMLALGAVMAVEKNVSWGRRLSAPLGIALLAWATFIVVEQGTHGL